MVIQAALILTVLLKIYKVKGSIQRTRGFKQGVIYNTLQMFITYSTLLPMAP